MLPGVTTTCPPARAGGIDGFFKITERGSTVARELRGGLVTFLTMAYIIVLNPIILLQGTGRNGDQLAATATSPPSPRPPRWSPA